MFPLVSTLKLPRSHLTTVLKSEIFTGVDFGRLRDLKGKCTRLCKGKEEFGKILPKESECYFTLDLLLL